MRHVRRLALPARVESYLEQRRKATDRTTDVESAWNRARQTKSMRSVFRTLQEMAGARQRCMYCVDSLGNDIEHFWPKSPYPDLAFAWSNMLLGCTGCGRLKGSRFPLSAKGAPMLVDPTAEDPWEHLDFDPDTGNLTARFDSTSGSPSPKGVCTVATLGLDRREGVTEGYRRSYRRVVQCVDRALGNSIAIDVDRLLSDLERADEHGLLGWCFGPIGATFPPFRELRASDPHVWAACVAAAQ